MKFNAMQSFATLIWAAPFLEAYAHDNSSSQRHVLRSRQLIEEGEDLYSDLVFRWRHRERTDPPKTDNADDNATLCTADANISTDKLLYYEGEEIHVSFEQCQAAENDWIGVYASDEDEDNLGEDGGNGKLWAYACGSQHCINETVHSGNFAFDNEYQDERGNGYWPLEKGRYKAHLIRDEWPFVSYAESNTFEVRCTDDATISTDKDSFDEGEEIEVYFDQCDPQPNDWIGIYDDDANVNFLGRFREDGQDDGHLWVYACSSDQDHEDCLNEDAYEGEVEFDDDYQDERGSGYWPLGPGRYRAHLIRASWGDYISIAESSSFEVVRTCDDDDEVETDDDSYQYGVRIRVSFEQCHPQPNDWIGIYERNADPNDLGDTNGDGLLWLYACSGDQDHQECINERVQDGAVEFENGYQDERGSGFWPLSPGWYKAHLVRASFEPYISIAESDAFEVVGQSNCIGDGACVGSPDLVFHGSNICIGRNACSYTSGAAELYSDACHGRNACNEMYHMDSHSIGSGSCQGSFACYDMSDTDVGSNSCRGDHACDGLRQTTVGDNSCNCDNCCDCRPGPVGDNSCNSLGECCG